MASLQTSAALRPGIRCFQGLSQPPPRPQCTLGSGHAALLQPRVPPSSRAVPMTAAASLVPPGNPCWSLKMGQVWGHHSRGAVTSPQQTTRASLTAALSRALLTLPTPQALLEGLSFFLAPSEPCTGQAARARLLDTETTSSFPPPAPTSIIFTGIISVPPCSKGIEGCFDQNFTKTGLLGS